MVIVYVGFNHQLNAQFDTAILQTIEQGACS